jgi:glucose/arabinose dehydrogenase
MGVTMVNRTVVTAVLTIAILCISSTSLAQLRSAVIASGFANPVALVPDPVIPGVLYVVEQGGLVRIIRDGAVLPAPFIDLRSAVSFGGERGLLGMAFSPDALTGRVYFNFTNPSGHTVVARFQRTTSFVVDPATRFDLLWPTGERFIRQPFSNHNGGHLAFGPDGFLYIGLGDGGSGNDPDNNAQNLLSPLGKMLRIDVNVADSDTTGYRVPAGNPLLNEIWALGLRNPWRYSFDDFGTGATGALIIGDVGQSAREEINYQPAGTAGRNYGWRIREGRIATAGVPPTNPGLAPLYDPIYDYPRTAGQSVTGGFVYRGSQLPAQYRGRYFFADFLASRVWSMGLKIDPVTREATAVDIIEHTAELGASVILGGISSFGRDVHGELYLTTFAGGVLRIAPDTPAPPNPPPDFRVVISNTAGVLSWTAPAEGPVPAQYRLEVGLAPGSSDFAVFALGGAVNDIAFSGIPPATYYTRLRSVDSAGASAPTPENVVIVRTGACTAAPPAPFGFAAMVGGRNVQLSWAMPDTDDGPTTFVIEAGSATGLANLAMIGINGSLRSLNVGAPPGTYFVRLRAQNGCGASVPSNEILVRVY